MNRDPSRELSEPVSRVDHVVGPHEAAVTIVEYGDFECPDCKQAAPAVRMMLEHFGGRICFVYRHFPLEEVHPQALLAAEAAEAAAGQGKFWQMHDLLFAKHPHFQRKQLLAYGEQLELDMRRYTDDLDDHIYLQRVREHMKSGHASGVRATPTFFLNGRLQDVSFGLERLHAAVETAVGK